MKLPNAHEEFQRFYFRIRIAMLVAGLLFLLLLARFVWLQSIQYEHYHALAESNRIALVPAVPARGVIYDRNGIVLASNFSAYTLEITPSKVGDLEDTIARLSVIVQIDAADRKRFKRLLAESKDFESIPIHSHLTEEEAARFAVNRFRFPGVEVRARLFRQYPFGNSFAHVVGYIGRINDDDLDNLAESEQDANYRGTDHIGKLGIEKSYERWLHGRTGIEKVEVGATGHAVRVLSLSPPMAGDNIYLNLDSKLQQVAETAFGQLRGSLVALEPKTGGVLALVSEPGFDPNLFVDGIDQDNWQQLNESIDKPLLNRALRGTYPAGSTYKPFMALAALTLAKRAPQTIINDPGFYMFGGHRFGSPENERGGPMDMHRAIVESSNAYFYSLANEIGVDAIHDFMAPLGFGQLTGIDINGEVRGVLPSTRWKRNYYKRPEQQKWYAGETISLGIGQGYNSFTMLQLAQATATVANGGVKHTPRLALATQDTRSGAITPLPAEPAQDLGFKPEHIDVIRNAMVGVTQAGTSARVFAGAAYLSGGKTGTAQAVSLGKNEKYSAVRMEERKRDHALYIAFAPAEAPKIAIAAIVENAGYGSASAAPITRRAFDYWLLGLYPNDEDLAATRNGQSSAPLGKPRPAVEVAWPVTSASAPE